MTQEQGNTHNFSSSVLVAQKTCKMFLKIVLWGSWCPRLENPLSHLIAFIVLIPSHASNALEFVDLSACFHSCVGFLKQSL